MYTETYLGEGQSPASSQIPASASSILVADCGTVFTKVSLLGLVEGQYRLMARGEAPTTFAAPYQDITKGIIQAINEVEFITGRHFVDNGRIISPEQPTGDGTDLFVVTISAGESLCRNLISIRMEALLPVAARIMLVLVNSQSFMLVLLSLLKPCGVCSMATLKLPVLRLWSPRSNLGKSAWLLPPSMNVISYSA